MAAMEMLMLLGDLLGGMSFLSRTVKNSHVCQEGVIYYTAYIFDVVSQSSNGSTTNVKSRPNFTRSLHSTRETHLIFGCDSQTARQPNGTWRLAGLLRGMCGWGSATACVAIASAGSPGFWFVVCSCRLFGLGRRRVKDARLVAIERLRSG